MKLWKKNKFLLLVAIILFLSIGFAILTVNLDIQGSFSFQKNEWNIHYDNIVINSGSVSNELPTTSGNELNFTTNLHSPGEYYSFNFDVVNSSTLNAMVDSVTISGIEESSKYVDCTVKYNNGTPISKNDILYTGYSTDLTVKVLYKDISLEEIPKDNINLNVTISINYKQANNDAKLVADTNFIRYDYIGFEQAFTPVKDGTYKIELWGASGGTQRQRDVLNNGAYVSGNIDLNKVDKLFVYTGSVGVSWEYGHNYSLFNGGGKCYFTLEKGNGGSGGGATDVRLIGGDWDDFNSLKSRIMVAAGGGGLGYIDNVAGAAGGLVGYDSVILPESNFKEDPIGLGGTQTSGVSWNIPFPIEAPQMNPSGFGFGGNSSGNWDGGGAGGSGYFGGSGGIVNSGGGGSSFISGHAGCVAISEDSEETAIKQKTVNGEVCTDNSKSIECSKHYSGKVFTNTVMIDGKGYKWTTEKESNSTGMPKYLGYGTETGHNGNGNAKITIMK